MEAAVRSVPECGCAAFEKTVDKTGSAKVAGRNSDGKKANTGFYGSITGYDERKQQNVHFRQLLLRG